MIPIKRRNIKSVILPNPVYSSDKRVITPVIDKMVNIINDITRKDKETKDQLHRK